MKRTHFTLAALALSALAASAQVSWNLNVGSEGVNLNVGNTPTFYYAPAPMLYAVPVNNYYYYDHGKKHHKQIKKARKQYQKAIKKARKSGYYAPVYVAPKPHKAKKHHKH